MATVTAISTKGGGGGKATLDEEGTVAAVLFGALRNEKTSLHLTNAPSTLCYRKEYSSYYGQALIVPRILTCGDMELFIEKSGGKLFNY